MTEESRARFHAEARAECPDPVLLCLLAGLEADPQADPDEVVAAAGAALDRLAEAVRRAVGERGPVGPAAQAALLAAVLAGRERFHGRPSDYNRLDSSLLPAVLKRRRGLPIMLSLVWAEVGRRAGLTVHGVALPGHFVAAVGDAGSGQVLVDPFHGGRTLTLEDAEQLVAAATGEALSEEMLAPAAPLDVVLRVLGNIRTWASSRPEHARTQLWATELSLLLPRHPAQLRLERAELLVRVGDFLGGAAEMESYAAILDAFDPDSAARVRLEAKAARHRLN
ncbi:transglutaminase family protein [Streptacidiphilus griseoplanus]|uniref:transglutaminase family protein n=1 Tax=Peterkaempfera griseoplana TaxID=66896 RepID=UPI0006E1556F|nr:transglutaminase-like domain-containing protein [Peterkaempfera griseoplana]